MNITSLRLRRLLTTVGVVAALVLGFGSIRAAAAWTAASAPIGVAPIPVSSIQDRLDQELARSEAMRAQLDSLAAQSDRDDGGARGGAGPDRGRHRARQGPRRRAQDRQAEARRSSRRRSRRRRPRRPGRSSTTKVVAAPADADPDAPWRRRR